MKKLLLFLLIHSNFVLQSSSSSDRRAYRLAREVADRPAHGVEQETKNQILVEAYKEGKINEMKFWLKEGADINGEGLNGRGLLWHATLLKREEDIEYFLQSGVTADDLDSQGETTLMYASKWEHEKVVKLLIEKGANCSLADKYGNTALHRVASNSFKHDGWNYEASKNRLFSIVSLLLQHGAFIDAQNDQGETPLMRAAGYRLFEIVDFLLQHGADCSVKDVRGNTVLHRVAGNSTISWYDSAIQEHQQVFILLLQQSTISKDKS